jgi:hypothetical protein
MAYLRINKQDEAQKTSGLSFGVEGVCMTLCRVTNPKPYTCAGSQIITRIKTRLNIKTRPKARLAQSPNPLYSAKARLYAP